jgi:hypothetical protein
MTPATEFRERKGTEKNGKFQLREYAIGRLSYSFCLQGYLYKQQLKSNNPLLYFHLQVPVVFCYCYCYFLVTYSDYVIPTVSYQHQDDVYFDISSAFDLISIPCFFLNLLIIDYLLVTLNCLS